MRPTRLLTGLAAVALVVLGLVAFVPDCASACSCALNLGITEQERAERALDRSSAVLAGEVVDLKRGFGTKKVSIRVSEVWKGPEQDALEVRTPSFGPACGYRFSEGQEYLVLSVLSSVTGDLTKVLHAQNDPAGFVRHGHHPRTLVMLDQGYADFREHLPSR